MTGDGTVRAISDLFRLKPRRSDLGEVAAGAVSERVFPSKAFPRLLAALDGRDAPVLVDLGPVLGANVTFFGERLGCKLFVEDLFADLEHHRQQDRLDALSEFFESRLTQGDASVDGVLCWDLLDFFPRPAARVLAGHLVRILRPGGVLLGFFATVQSPGPLYTKYEIVDEQHLRHRPYAGNCPRQGVLQNRDIIRLFEGLVVADSFLLKINTREMLFRKGAADKRG